MERGNRKYTLVQRMLALALALIMAAGYIPVTASAATGDIGTIADPPTMDKNNTIYSGSTLNAGKITVDKSVSNDESVLGMTPGSNNFLVTLSQSAQTMGLSSESSVPVDVVFVLDTSNSMAGDKVTAMITAANSVIKSLMEANEYNRVAVVAFSGKDGKASGFGANSNDAANVLTSLGHYDVTGDHIVRVNENGKASNSGDYIQGQANSSGQVGRRKRTSTGTNIHAGVALGGKLLAEATDITVTVNGQSVTRMPFLVVLSDGAPTHSLNSTNWYAPELNTTTTTSENAGHGFLAAMTAAYYKGKITEHYYGSKASAQNRCYVYTMGLGISNSNLALTTMNPSGTTSGSTYNTFAGYWTNYEAGNSFTIDRGSSVDFTVTAASIAETKNYVNGKNSGGSSLGYTGGWKYNDKYFGADGASDLANAFDDVMTEIQKQALSNPTHVDITLGHDFSGYVHFTDPLGEFMEVKNVRGIYANGILYQGTAVANHLNGTASNTAIDTKLAEALAARTTMTDATASTLVDQLIAGRKASDYITDNSITWWGNAYNVDGEEDAKVQCLGYAENNTVEYIQSSTAPDGANVVCRSYFFYGTAGGTAGSATNHEYMYLVVRTQRSLEAPYKQTVIVSIPASLLSVDEAFITETTENGQTTYTAEVKEEEPVRVVYEVGLRSDITAQNVASVVEKEMPGYTEEVPNGGGSVNYDGNQYHFFTNDWNRAETGNSHHRAMTTATFDAAADNAYYVYQTDTLLVDGNGNAVTSQPAAGTKLYYLKEVYTWSGTPENNVYSQCTKGTERIPVTIPSDSSVLKEIDGKWHVKAGTYTALGVANNDNDDVKTSNTTGSSSTVAHKHRTSGADNSHYTVWLGNNGKLSISYDPPKSVYKTDATTNTLVDADGKAVMVGDILTYKIRVTNNEGDKVTATITDTVPAGTEFVQGSAKVDTNTVNIEPDSNGKLTWSNIEVYANSTVVVSFQVKVTADALAETNVSNTATIRIGNNPSYTTNTTTNPPQGKNVAAADNDGTPLTGNLPLKVGDQLTYTIRYINDTNSTATVTVTDKIPEGTTYDGNSKASYDAANKTLTWTIPDVPAGIGGTVSFTVYVNASAKIDASGTQPETGEITIRNDAAIQIGENGPTVKTNSTGNKVGVGNIALKKAVAENVTTDQVFTLILTDSAKNLNGTYAMTGGSDVNTVTFENGIANVPIKNGEILVIKGLPLGTTITVTEDVTNLTGWADSYDKTSVVVSDDTAKTVDNAVQPDITVTNTRVHLPVKLQLSGVKKFQGTFPEGDYTFGFTAAPCNEDGTVTGTDGVQAIAVKGTDNTDVTFHFAELTFSEPTTAYYLVTENVPDDIKISSDPKQYLLKVEVAASTGTDQLVATVQFKTRADAGAGWTEWAGWTASSIAFTNTYPSPVTASITGSKELTGRYITDGEFSFELLDNEKKVISNTGVVADGTSNTGTFSFLRSYSITDMIGTDDDGNEILLAERIFTYYIRETNNGVAGVTYDASLYKVEVKVTLTGSVLGADVTSITKYADDNGSGEGTNAEKVAFANTFTPQETSVHLYAQKSLTGDGAYDLQGGEFSFSVYEADAGYSITNTTPVGGGSNDANGSVNLGELEYVPSDIKDASGNYVTKTFYYVVKENVPAADGPTYDPNVIYSGQEYHVSCTVSIDEDGKMTATVTGADAIEGKTDSYQVDKFTNTRVKDEVDFTPSAIKTTTGEHLPEGLRFSFAVRPTTVSGNKADLNVSGVAATGISRPIAGGNGADKTVDFTKMVFTSEMLGTDSSKEFYYIIEESNTAVTNGVTYDTGKYLLTVTLSRNSETKVLSATGSYAALADDGTIGGSTEAPSFKNVYNAKASVNITAGKSLSGRTLADKEFDFKLQRLDKNGDEYSLADGSAVDGINNADGTVTFGTLNFTDDGNLDLPETGYDKIPVESEPVVASEESDGDAETDDGTELDDGTETDDAESGGSGENEEALMPADVEDGSTETTIERKYALVRYLMSEIRPDDVPLAGVTYDTSEYIVTIKLWWEESEDGNSSTLEAALYGVNKANKSGGGYTLGDAVSFDAEEGSTGVTFANSYTPVGEAKATITATKTLTGRALKAGEFTFALYRVGGSGEPIATATNDADGNVTFERKYNSSVLASAAFVDNEYSVIYHLTESDPTTGGVSKVSGDYYVKVVITHDTANASYSVSSVKYYTDESCTNEVQDVVFVNKYEPAGTSFTPEASKQLLDKDGNKLAITDNQFSFTVKEIDESGNVINANAGTGNSGACASGESSQISFTPITIGGAGNGFRYYLIEEVAGTNALVTYSKEKLYVRVPVTDDGNGKLSVGTAQYYSDHWTTAVQNAEFTNHKGNGEVDVSLSLNIDKTVHVLNADDTLIENYKLTGDEFDFNLYKYDNETKGDFVANGTNGGASDQGIADIVFTNFKVTLADMDGAEQKTFHYIVEEVNPGTSNAATGTAYDTVPIIVAVAVTADTHKNLSVESVTYTKTGADEGEENLFVNEFKFQPTTLALSGTKSLNGMALADGQFEFQISGGNLAEPRVVANSAPAEGMDVGQISFGELEFIQPGVYTFKVEELDAVQDNKHGTYYTDPDVFTVVVTVVADRSGRLVATPMYYYNETKEAVGGISFSNLYTPNPVTLDLNERIDIRKIITDGKDAVLDLPKDGFVFELDGIVDDKGKKITATTDAAGLVDFPALTFKQAADYIFYIRESESQTGKPGYQVDANVWMVTVKVGYNTENGELYIAEGDVTVRQVVQAAEVSVDEGVAVADVTSNPTVTFANVYDPVQTTLTIPLKKSLSGRTMKEGEFTFRMTDSEGTIAAEATNNADGTVELHVTYTGADMDGAKQLEGSSVLQRTINYTIEELPGTAGGVAYDRSKKHVSVTLTADAEGKLSAEVTAAGENMVFTNSYTAAETTVEITATKQLEGLTLSEGMFSFILTDSEGNQVGEPVANRDDGSIIFALTYDSEDMTGEKVKTFTYTLSEVVPKSRGLGYMEYDDTQHPVTVTVTDDWNGNLNAVVTYGENGTESAPVFHNTYVGKGTSVVFSAKKRLITDSSRVLKDGEFSFELLDEAGNVLETRKNNGDGKVNFTAIVFESEGTFHYTIREAAGSENGMKYDKTEYAVTVNVTRNSEGDYQASVTYGTEDGKAPAFVNEFEPLPIQVTLEANKKLTGRKLKAEEFKFRVSNEKGKKIASGTNNAEGKIIFEPITLSEPGVYKYTVRETRGMNWYITYDTKKYEVTVTVTEEGGVLTAEVSYPGKGITFRNVYDNSSLIPLTGDNTPLAMLAGVMILSGGGIVAMLMLRRRKRRLGKSEKR